MDTDEECTHCEMLKRRVDELEQMLTMGIAMASTALYRSAVGADEHPPGGVIELGVSLDRFLN